MTQYRRHERAESRRLGEETVLLHLDTEQYHALNATGTVLWERLEDPATADELAAVLVEHYAIDETRAHDDVAQFVGELTSRDLIT